MTQIITQNLTSGASVAVQITAGQYMIAVGGAFDSATASLFINVGPAVAVPVSDAVYTEPKAEILWLPDCTLYMAITDAGAATKVNVALAALSTKVK